MDPGELFLGDARLGQAILALGMGAPAAQRPDIEDVGPERRLERGIVELGIVGQRHHGRRDVEAHLLEGLVGPVLHDLDAGKAVGRGPGAAWIDDGDVEVEHGGHRRQALRDVHGATMIRRAGGT